MERHAFRLALDLDLHEADPRQVKRRVRGVRQLDEFKVVLVGESRRTLGVARRGRIVHHFRDPQWKDLRVALGLPQRAPLVGPEQARALTIAPAGTVIGPL